ncbi:MAG: hypothetical protein JSW34_08725 [Candidatus Zixiibacteriota bacterium]|nr:MAG: hypothetical protein JSW34_08725 [candidate division Zixibacteria bacterium]
MRDLSCNRGLVGWRLITPVLIALLLGATFWLSGCSNGPLEVNTTESETSFFDLPFDEVEFTKGGKTYDGIYYADDYIKADEGGLLTVTHRGATFTFEVMPNSISDDMLITLVVYVVEDTPEQTTIIYEFGPDGLVFSEPAILTLEAEAVTGEGSDSVDWYYLDRGRWMYQGSFHAEKDGKIRIQMEHFSRWGTD